MEPGNKSTGPIQLAIEGMHCAGCATKIEGALKAVPGVKGAAVNFAAETAQVLTNSSTSVNLDNLLTAVKNVGYTAHHLDGSTSYAVGPNSAHQAADIRSLRLTFFICAALSLSTMAGSFLGWP